LGDAAYWSAFALGSGLTGTGSISVGSLVSEPDEVNPDALPRLLALLRRSAHQVVVNNTQGNIFSPVSATTLPEWITNGSVPVVATTAVAARTSATASPSVAVQPPSAITPKVVLDNRDNIIIGRIRPASGKEGIYSTEITGPDINGSGITVAVLEAESVTGATSYRIDFGHEFFNDLASNQKEWFDYDGSRITPTAGFSRHATNVAGVVHGLAWNAKLLSGPELSDLTLIEKFSTSNGNAVLIVNQSYNYQEVAIPKPDTPTQALDKVLFQKRHTLAVQTAGNERGRTGFPVNKGNITAHNTTAKNNLVVGAWFTSGISGVPESLASFSNFGPAADGRLTPQLVAPGVNIYMPDYKGGVQNPYHADSGTSFAAPAVSGGAALVADLLKQKKVTATSPMLKALLVHGATDLVVDFTLPVIASDLTLAAVQAGPDYPTGYGLLNINESLSLVNKAFPAAGSTTKKNTLVVQSSLTLTKQDLAAGSKSFLLTPIAPLAGENEIKATLVWLDPQGNQSYDISQGSYLNFEADLLARGPSGSEVGSWKLDPFQIGKTAWKQVRSRIQSGQPGKSYIDNVQQLIMKSGPAQNGMGLHLSWKAGATQQATLNGLLGSKNALEIPYALVIEGIDASRVFNLSMKNVFIKTKESLSEVLDMIILIDNSTKDKLGHSILSEGSTSASVTNPGLPAPSTSQGGLGLIKKLKSTLDEVLAKATDYATDQINTQLRDAGVFDADDGFTLDDATGNIFVKFDRTLDQLVNLPAINFDSDLGLESLGFNIKGTGVAKGAFALNFGVDALSAGTGVTSCVTTRVTSTTL
jgi:hypothetical protein